MRGWMLSDPLPKVDFTLESMRGDSFDFLVETEGFVTLLFFGYTYCPDICPLHMANIGAVLKKLQPEVANKVIGSMTKGVGSAVGALNLDKMTEGAAKAATEGAKSVGESIGKSMGEAGSSLKKLFGN